MIVALMIWLVIIIFALVFGTYLCYRIEKHGVERWGATGSLFRYKQKGGE
ncbi:hypothetical protein [Tuberibacillus sp. Marseille-P3662]|nr:hypothetical protein [Tuberibacillus sp. Marseille-P3662]